MSMFILGLYLVIAGPIIAYHAVGIARDLRLDRERAARWRLREERRLTPEQERKLFEEWDREIAPPGWRKESWPGVYSKPMLPEWERRVAQKTLEN